MTTIDRLFLEISRGTHSTDHFHFHLALLATVLSSPPGSPECVRSASTGGRSTPMSRTYYRPSIESRRAYQYLLLLELLLTVIVLVLSIASTFGLL